LPLVNQKNNRNANLQARLFLQELTIVGCVPEYLPLDNNQIVCDRRKAPAEDIECVSADQTLFT
jgi:hypothetical protein